MTISKVSRKALSCIWVLSLLLGLALSAGAGEQAPVPVFRPLDTSIPEVVLGKAAAGSTNLGQSNLTAAALAQLIDANLYYYVPGDAAYRVWNVVTPGGCPLNSEGQVAASLPMYQAFWVRALQDVNIAFNNTMNGRVTPSLVPPTTNPTQLAIPDTYLNQLNLILDQIISIPCAPYVTDISASVNYDKVWWEKWVNGGLADYNGDGFADYGYFSAFKNGAYTDPSGATQLMLAPGRAFWITSEDRVNHTPATDYILFQGLETPVNNWFRYSSVYFPEYAVRLPASNSLGGALDNVGDHMVGNPFMYTISMTDVWIETPYRPEISLGKFAAGLEDAANQLSSVDAWSVKLSLTDANGGLADVSNRVGVIESGADLHSLFNAQDLVGPLADYIRLSMVNPENTNSRLAWDYRGPSQDTYEWNLELSTTISSIATKLSLSDFALVPEGYLVTLKDTSTGQVYTLDGDATFDVALTSSAPKTFVLTATRQKPTVVEEAAPTAVKLTGAYPNPFNPSTTISFDINRAGNVSLKVYNIEGQLVETLVDRNMSAGSHEIKWNAAHKSSGVYLMVLRANGYAETRKITLMK